MKQEEQIRKPLTAIYLPEVLLAEFPTLEDEIVRFLEKNKGRAANLQTPAHQIEEYAADLQGLARTILTGVEKSETDPVSLYLNVTQPARSRGDVDISGTDQVGIMTLSTNHRYHMLERVFMSSTDQIVDARDLLILLQRLPPLTDTGPEVHGLKKTSKQKLVSSETGGIEVYIPLVDGITFHVNDNEFTPTALKGMVTILPGDNHHHVKNVGTGPARVVIVTGFGFTRGIKTNKSFARQDLAHIPRFTLVK